MDTEPPAGLFPGPSLGLLKPRKKRTADFLENRGRGAGRALLSHLARRCLDENLGRLEWAVLDWNALAIGFYDRLGATAKTEWITRQLSGDALARLAETETAP